MAVYILELTSGEGVPVVTKVQPRAVLTAPECCPAGLAEPMNRSSAESLAQILKAVADPARLQLLSLLRAADGGEACVCDLTEPLGLTQPTVSHHLKVLVEAGLVRRERRGTWAWYSLVTDRIAEIGALFC